MEEIVKFDQEDLNEDDVFILDAFYEIYVWHGSDASDNEKVQAAKIAEV